MSIRIAKKEDKRSIYSIMSYCFNIGNSYVENNCKDDEYPYEQFLVSEKDGIVNNVINIVPFKMMFNGKFYNMGGIAGVSSLPEDRGNRSIASLLTKSMEYMKERNMIFSSLAPFAMSFYRKYGYEWGVTWQLINIPINDLREFKSAKKYVSLNKNDNAIIEQVRDEFIKNMNGPVFHDEKILNDRWNGFYNSFTHCYASYDENNNINAIAFYKIEGRELKVEEFYYLNEIGKENMLHFFFTHRSQVDSVELITTTKDNTRNILPNCRIKYWQWPFVMIRVVVVKDAIEAMQINKDIQKFTIKVNDEQAPWNNKVFSISSKNLKITVEEENTSNYDFEINIQRLSQLVFGFIDAKEAIETNQIKVFNQSSVSELNKLFIKKETMMWQKF